MEITLGSLFDGSGTFCLASLLCDIKPLWLSEIEPFPLCVTHKRFPFIKQYGDIKKLHGYDLPFVDIITGGSPCTDISLAGKKEGIHASRSGLFFEMIRIIKEMRQKSEGKYPRFIIWENVYGAFVSNKGEDFKCVLEEICRIKEPTVSISKPTKWLKAGSIVGNTYSIAYRTLDAQYWGVPQHRERIFLVADFDGHTATEILFKPESLSGYSHEMFKAWQEITRNAPVCFGESNQDLIRQLKEKAEEIKQKNKNIKNIYDVKTLQIRSGKEGGGKGALIQDNLSATLGCNNTQTLFLFDNNGTDARYTGPNNVSQTLTQYLGTGGNSTPLVIHSKNLCVRKLLPEECARLQGFPSWWAKDIDIQKPTDKDIEKWINIFEEHNKALNLSKKTKTQNQIKKWLQNPYSDSAEYKMWGNGIAFPCAWYIIQSIKTYIDKENK